MFKPEETPKTVTAEVTGDTARETDEAFFRDLLTPAYAALGRSRGRGRTRNDDRWRRPARRTRLGSPADVQERQNDAAADRLRRVLAGMADAVAGPFVETHAAFDRFARRHVGVDGPTLMRAWQFPRAADLAATLVVFKYVKAREGVVAELAEQVSAAWDTRVGGEGNDAGE